MKAWHQGQAEQTIDIKSMAVITALILLISVIWGGSAVLIVGALIVAAVSDRFRIAVLGDARPGRRVAAEQAKFSAFQRQISA